MKIGKLPFSEGTQKAYTVIIDRICKSLSAVASSTLSQSHCKYAVPSCTIRRCVAAVHM